MRPQRHWFGRVSAAVAFLATLAVAAPAIAATGNSEPAAVPSDDVRALVAPVALYPDPILALVLQASTLPIQVVEAERFLAKREKDKTLTPDPDWDKSIVALLNYPRQVKQMSEYLDWTEELGDRVVEDLDGVQAAIQDVRLAAYDAGFLKSDKHQKVEVVDDQVRITSTDPDKVTIPRYAPSALLAALDAAEAADDSADAAAAPPAPAPATPKQKASAPAAPQQPLAESPPAEAAPLAAAPAAAPAVVPAAAPVAAPVITYGQPENTFWSSAATFAGGAVVGGLLGWGLTEAFDDDDHDHHHHDNDDWDNDDIEDALRERREYGNERRDDMLAAQSQRQQSRSEMAAQRQSSRAAAAGERQSERDQRQAARQGQADERRVGRDQQQAQRQGERDQRQASRGESREERAARAREQLNERPQPVGGRSKPAAAASARAERAPARAERGTREVRLPNAGTRPTSASRPSRQSTARAAARPAGGDAARATAARQRAQSQAGYSRPNFNQGIAAGAGNRRQVRTEANRGAASRAAAPRAISQQRAAPVRAQAPRSGGGIAAGHNGGGGAARAASARGQGSRLASAGGGRARR